MAADAEEDEEELEQAQAWLMTYWDCPHCQETQELEGHVSDEIVTCQFCQKKSKIGHVA